VTAVSYRSGDVAILDVKISAKIRYGNLAHVSDGCRQKHCIQNCGQKAGDREMVTFNSLYVVVIALSNGIIANSLRRTV